MISPSLTRSTASNEAKRRPTSAVNPINTSRASSISRRRIPPILTTCINTRPKSVDRNGERAPRQPPPRPPPITSNNVNQEHKESRSNKPRAAALLARRIRYIINQLDRGELSPDDLRKNLEYAALVLETAYMDDTRRLLEEDDDSVDFSPEAVPEEVRAWLASTFTKQTAVQRKKPKFKSVANVIRSGIAFDKIYRRLSAAPQVHIIPQVAAVLKDVNSWGFDIFHLNEVSANTALKQIGLELFQRYNFLGKYKIALPVLEGFLSQLETGYSKYKNPYHNLVHAADVTQTTYWMLSQTGLSECMSELEIFATLFASMIHDYEHTGHTNNFHIQSNSDFAILYNDRSVLENHHVSSVFRFMRDTAELSVLANLNKEEYREFRNLVVEMVLATDMSTHFAQVKAVKNMLSLPEGIDKVKALCLIVHCCDISHPAKPWRAHHRWTTLVLEEFFRQGDIEAQMGLPFSPLCDRQNTQIAQSQIGFIDFIVEPTLMVCVEMVTKMVEPMVVMPASEDSRAPSSDPNHLTVSADSTSSNGENKRLPLTPEGKLNIPQPWLKVIQENKVKWKELAAREEMERKKQQEDRSQT